MSETGPVIHEPRHLVLEKNTRTVKAGAKLTSVKIDFDSWYWTPIDMALKAARVAQDASREKFGFARHEDVSIHTVFATTSVVVEYVIHPPEDLSWHGV